ncbi:cyclin N-terminal domain-containing protein 1 [Triplophysa rosa]|uniref:Cyclin N-terminal domain-containing protein 1 n=1 Tax=Triplophysa rosa TaxID=992332 RepID=A0A9W7TIF9_TRIRA|nr:cyclin N-terminal domain-containing protein 1 [Triplophysa rosa]KAI7796657.1 putative cyclin N-terminal domain-containing protein 1 [Triplophysa rosa]
MAKRVPPKEPERNLGFGRVSMDILSDILTNLNNRNKSNLENVSYLCGNLRDRKIAEYVFHLCAELGLDPVVGYYAIEMLNRFMAKYLEDLIRRQKRQPTKGAPCKETGDYKDLIYQTLKEKFFVLILSSVQIASKLDLHSNVVNNNIAMDFLHRVSYPCSKEKLLDSEIFILKTLNFNLNVPNALTYVETLLEVLGHNDPTAPVAQLHRLCVYVLQFIYLQREAIYNSLLISATGSPNPSYEQRAKFVSVTEDFMLLGVGVIAVAAFIHHISTWEKVVDELTGVTGISGQSIMDFAYVTLMHITKIKPV